jgi:hypothetical protein
MSKTLVVGGGDDNDEIGWTQSGKKAGRKSSIVVLETLFHLYL